MSNFVVQHAFLHAPKSVLKSRNLVDWVEYPASLFPNSCYRQQIENRFDKDSGNSIYLICKPKHNKGRRTKMATENIADSSAEEHGEEHLKDIFLKAWNIFEELETTSLAFNSSEFQSKVKLAKEHLELATGIVSRVGMFSANELIDEVSTESLQYLLLPFFLGKLTLKLSQENRFEVLRVAEIYFRDYLQRCEDYELCNPSRKSENKEEIKQQAAPKNELAELMQAAHSRNDKIAQFRIKKELEEQIKELKHVLHCNTVDEELKREFFLKFIKKCIIEAREELESLHLEKKMVEMHRLQMCKGEGTEVSGNAPCGSQSRNHHNHHGQAKPKPLQPFIITRDATQKAVFGMGYPSLPIMTVDEFYQQRVDEGIFPDEEKQARINHEKAIAEARDPEEQEEEEKSAVEQQIESDDPEYLARMRRMDEYKDIVRRGDGNRHNRS